ncbi:endo-1,4-beta-xylanase [Gramella sp. GC03-9]|uniref:Beta-xylanase n=1 Tax=Christiangramia oceanisediminis TaxID=2920386 RepID=A0A9X2I9A3_9FLAO|nr:endo-1,4-beta-xylanase [Gramella oceanisediminis]MCP9199073.1 endo-1,4-beta-xylanase [Gramella oceanisediminis]
MKKVFRMLIILLVVTGCSTDDDGGPKVGGPTDPVDGGNGDDGGDGDAEDPFTYTAASDLKEVVDFPIGNIVSASKLASGSAANQTFREVLNREYNSITAENDMKMANIYRGPGNYDFSDGDAIIDYAKANGLRVHGHTLVWHASIPSWLENFDGTDEEFETLIEDYVKATVSHFAQETMTYDGEEVSVVAGWDVVNEVWDGSSLRNTLFRERMGDDYAAKLFTWAREADPDVKLFYNDYNIAGDTSKRNLILGMVNNFINNDVPIDGIGMQMHLNHNWPVDDLPTAIEQVAATGLLVHISELDVKVNYNDDISEFTVERAQTQEEQYQRAAYHYVTKVPEDQQYGLTIWGFRDNDSWLYDNGNDWPLLYNNDFETKIAHRGLVQGLQGTAP